MSVAEIVIVTTVLKFLFGQYTPMQTNLLIRSSKEIQMSDFQVLPFDFSATTVTFVANNTNAKDRICGGVSCEVRKSAAPEFAAKLEAEGFTVSY